MINQIVEAIATLLGDAFPDCHCYIQDTIQNIKEPCFIIKRVSASQRERLGDRVMLDELYSVSFLCPENIKKLREVTELAELYLRFIDIEGDLPIMTHNRESRIIDDSTSSITFEITRTVWFKTEDPVQEHLIHSTEVTNGEN